MQETKGWDEVGSLNNVIRIKESKGIGVRMRVETYSRQMAHSPTASSMHVTRKPTYPKEVNMLGLIGSFWTTVPNIDVEYF